MKIPPAKNEPLSIAEASARSGLSPDTLRYYDKFGILPNLRRNGGRRSFSGQDMAALSLISCLRDTGMPLKSIRDFMRAAGPRTADARLAILRRHLAEVDGKLETYRKARLRVEFKIWFYEEAKRLGGVAKLPPLDELLKRYRKETGKSTDW
ncbi:MAG: MerR family transcriptional regulator [Kiritimatiellae bacterium]|nr:MerR family transcriptional regulator [Kiritimatiellia bacterium]